MDFAIDHLIFGPDDVDLGRSPLAGAFAAETYALGAFNPGLTRLENGNLLMMVRVAEALRNPIADGHVRAIRWTGGRLSARRTGRSIFAIPPIRANSWCTGGACMRDGADLALLAPPRRTFARRAFERVAIHYGQGGGAARRLPMLWRRGCPHFADRRPLADDDLLGKSRTAFRQRSIAQRTGSTGASEDIVLDHQNKDMLIFEGRIDGRYWAQTRPLGDLYFAYPPGSEWRAGPSINLATSPDALHWKPHLAPGIRPHADTPSQPRGSAAAPRRSSPMMAG